MTTLISPDQERVRINLDAYCFDCKHWHRLGLTPQTFTEEMWEWEAKHRGHNFEFLSPKRRIPAHFDDQVFEKAGKAPWWLEFSSNSNIKIAYNTPATALTCTLASLATSVTFIAGRETTVVVNTSNLYLDYRITAKITAGTTPTVDKEIRIYAYDVLDDTPTYHDTFTGADAAVTLTNTYILDAGLAPIGSSSNSATSNIGYPIRCLTIAEAFGYVPTHWGLYVTHNTGVNLNSTGGNHILKHVGAYFTSS